MVLTYRLYIEPEAIIAESSVKPLTIPVQPTTECAVEVSDTTPPEDIERVDAAMATRGYIRTSP